MFAWFILVSEARTMPVLPEPDTSEVVVIEDEWEDAEDGCLYDCVWILSDAGALLDMYCEVTCVEVLPDV